MRKGLWFFCLGTGTVLLLAGDGIRIPAFGLVLTATACFLQRREPRRIRSLVKFMIPILVFLGAYGLLLHLVLRPGSFIPHSTPPMQSVAHVFLRSVGVLFAVFALEEAIRPFALRARAGGGKGKRMALMLGLSYQLVPIFLQSLEGVSLSQRASSNLWWLRPSRLMRAASAAFLLSHRLSEEMALALSLRLRHGGPSGANWGHDLSSRPDPSGSSAPAKTEMEP